MNNDLKFLAKIAEEEFARSLNLGEFFMKKLVAYFKDESGQTSTEYILLVAVVAMIIFKFKGKMDAGLSTVTDTVFGRANDLAEEIGKPQ